MLFVLGLEKRVVIDVLNLVDYCRALEESVDKAVRVKSLCMQGWVMSVEVDIPRARLLQYLIGDLDAATPNDLGQVLEKWSLIIRHII